MKRKGRSAVPQNEALGYRQSSRYGYRTNIFSFARDWTWFGPGRGPVLLGQSEVQTRRRTCAAGQRGGRDLRETLKTGRSGRSRTAQRPVVQGKGRSDRSKQGKQGQAKVETAAKHREQGKRKVQTSAPGCAAGTGVGQDRLGRLKQKNSVGMRKNARAPLRKRAPGNTFCRLSMRFGHLEAK